MLGERSSENLSWIKEWDSGDEDDSETDTRDKQRQAATPSPESIDITGSDKKASLPPPLHSSPISPEVDESAAFDLLLPDSERVSPLQFHESVTGFALQEWNAPIVKGTKASGRKRGGSEARSANTRSRRTNGDRLARREESISKPDHVSQSPRARRRSNNNNNNNNNIISRSEHDDKKKRILRDESPSPKFNSKRSSSRERLNSRASSREKATRRHTEEKDRDFASKERTSRTSRHTDDKEVTSQRRVSSRERASRRYSNEKEFTPQRPSSRDRGRRNANDKDLTSTSRSSSRERLSPRMSRTPKSRADISSRDKSGSPRPRRRAHSSERLSSRHRPTDRGQSDRRRTRSRDKPLNSENKGNLDDVTRSPGAGRRRRAADRRNGKQPVDDKEGQSKQSPALTEHEEPGNENRGEEDLTRTDYDINAGCDVGTFHGAQLQFEGSTLEVVKADAAGENGLDPTSTVALPNADDPATVDGQSKSKRPTTLRGMSRMMLERSSSISNLASKAITFTTAKKSEKAGVLESIDDDIDSLAADATKEDTKLDHDANNVNVQSHSDTSHTAHLNQQFDEQMDTLANLHSTKKHQPLNNAMGETGTTRRAFERSSSISNLASRALKFASVNKTEKKSLLDSCAEDNRGESQTDAIQDDGLVRSSDMAKHNKTTENSSLANANDDQVPTGRTEQPGVVLSAAKTSARRVFERSSSISNFASRAIQYATAGKAEKTGLLQDVDEMSIQSEITAIKHFDKMSAGSQADTATVDCARVSPYFDVEFPDSQLEKKDEQKLVTGAEEEGLNAAAADTKPTEDMQEADKSNRESVVPALQLQKGIAANLPKQPGRLLSATPEGSSGDNVKGTNTGSASLKEPDNKKTSSPRKISFASRRALNAIDGSDDRSVEALPESRSTGKVSKWKTISNSVLATGEVSEKNGPEDALIRPESDTRDKPSGRNDLTPPLKSASKWDALKHGHAVIEEEGRNSSDARRRRRRAESTKRRDEAKKEKGHIAGNEHRSSSSDRRGTERASQAKWAALKHGNAFIKNTEKRACESRRRRRRRNGESNGSHVETKQTSSNNDIKTDSSTSKASKWSALRAKVASADQPIGTLGSGGPKRQGRIANSATEGTAMPHFDAQSPIPPEETMRGATGAAVVSQDPPKSLNWNKLKAGLGKVDRGTPTEKTERTASSQGARSSEDDEQDATGRIGQQSGSTSEVGLGGAKDGLTGPASDQHIELDIPVEPEESGSRELDRSSHWQQLKAGLGKINDSQGTNNREKRVLRNGRGANKWAALRHGQEFISQTKNSSRRRRARSNDRGEKGIIKNDRPSHENRSRRTTNDPMNAELEDPNPGSDRIDCQEVADESSQKHQFNSTCVDAQLKDGLDAETGEDPASVENGRETMKDADKIESSSPIIPRSLRKIAQSSRWGNFGDLVATSRVSAEESQGSGANTEDTIESQMEDQPTVSSGSGKSDTLSLSRHGQSSRKSSKWAMVKGGLAFISKMKQETEKKHAEQKPNAAAEAPVDIVSAAQKQAEVFKKRPTP